MKKIALLVLIAVLFFWINAHRNEFAVWFNSDSFYEPLFSSEFDVLHPGSAVRCELTPSYDIKHGFFLVFPCETLPVDFFANLDGVIKYTIEAEGVELESRSIHIPAHPISVLKDSGCEIVLFTFDLPYKGHKKITLDVVLESPITKLASYQGDFLCKIYPAYWPK